MSYSYNSICTIVPYHRSYSLP